MEFDYKTVSIPHDKVDKHIEDQNKDGWVVEGMWQLGDNTIITYAKERK